MGETEDERTAQAGQLFETFVQATTCKGTLQAFSILCRQMDLDPLDYTHFYSRLKAAISSWKVKSLWTKLDKRAGQKVYNHGEACQGTKCLIVGGGPCGLRTAIELALLGCKVVVIEKRDTFSRNNVLHLWPYTIHDLRALGAKNFYGKFCAGSLDHISIRQLQLMLIKVCLILGVEIHVNVEFVELLEPREDQSDSDSPGWRVAIRPSDHPVTEIDFDVVIGADGRKNTLDGFSRKEFRGKLAIAITANFVNRNTTAEASVEEISGVAFIFNQKFFLDLKEETGIDLENIVYYKDNTHYFVMTAKKQSLLDKGVILNDHMETERLLHRDNIDNEALRSYAREAADFGTNYQLPSLDYAVNSYDQPDVTMFDFTSMYASENAALLRERHGRQVLVALVGDSLLEPFWPMGTGCARGFLAAFDTAWMVRGWTQGRSPLDVLAERESLYRLLPQTTTENINKHFEQYSIEPSTRYPNLNSSVIRPHQVRHLLMNGQEHSYPVERRGPSRRSTNFSSTEAVVHQSELLTWCQKQTQDYRGVEVTDLGSSWRDGLALCSLIHHQRPDLIDFESLAAEDSASNNQLAFDLAEREFGIQPVTTGKELALEQQPDQLLLVLYLSKFYEAFRRLPGGHSDSNEPDENNEKSSGKTNHTLLNQPHHRKRIPKNDKKLEDNDSTNKKRRKGTHYLAELSCQSAPLAGTDGELQENKDRSMASLLAKFEENSSSTRLHNKGSVRKATAPGLGGSDTCHFCLKRVYIMERLSAEGHFFHRECFRCAACGCTLRLGTHSFDSQQGNFYCKNHVKQRLGTKPDAFKKKMSDHNGVGTSGSSSLSSSRATNGLPAAGPHAPTSGGHAGLFVVSGQGAQKGLPGTCPVAGMVEEVLEATEASADTGGHKDSDPPCPDKSSRWKRKIRAAFPLLFVKRSSSEAKAGPAESAVRRQSIREEDSKDGQLLGGKQSAPSGNSGGVGGGDVSKALAEKRPVSSDRREEETAPVPSSGPKKRLMMTAFEKQKLLDWDLPLTSDTPTPRLEDQVPPMSRSKPDQSQTDVGRVEDPISDQTPASPLSTFQLFTNSLRKSFSGNRTSSSFNAAASVIIPTSSKPEGPHKPKVPSNSLFGLGSGQPQPESGKDLPAVMRGLSLAGQQGSAEGAFSDDMATLPPRRKLNFFSSLRLRKRDASQSESVEVDGQDKVRAILANLRNKASSEQHLEESLSSDDEEPCQSANQKVSLERQRKQQEKTVAQHAKREQLKRLHRAQAIQRHLEEVGERQRVVEERGVTLEKSLRGETGETHRADEETENQLHQSWFNLVLEKNRLARYESELMIFAQELELQDTQCRLQQDLRRKMAIEDTTKSASELQGEQELLSELMRTVERRDTLVSLLEEQRLSERDEDRDLESLSRGYELHWSPGQSLGWWDNLEGSGVEPGSQGDTLG
ncbi:F-actin-monooxygenase mical2b isoform X6 [Gadus macrocephalus]|uniref:F-actin-monooxygenase mical2b isoform X6 n=1 Tax=Gadus macrocephalus TaxID=80720 RepID=UPI0028CB24A3|nr:F-actin-monooxygenase mical2b isoform X6 [Gadus macrocephalus]